MATTRIFQPVPLEGHEWVQPVEERDFDAIYQLDGSPAAERWSPIPVRRLEVDDQGRPLQPSDLPWLGSHALVLRDRAYRAIGGLLAASGEFLELDLVDGTDRLWLYNVCCIADVLDEAASDLVRFPSTGRVMQIRRHVFSSAGLEGLVAFRVPQVRSLFLTDAVIDAITGSQLRAGFEVVWRDDQARV